jgi:hypothetical protein
MFYDRCFIYWFFVMCLHVCSAFPMLEGPMLTEETSSHMQNGSSDVKMARRYESATSVHQNLQQLKGDDQFSGPKSVDCFRCCLTYIPTDINEIKH